ncbi:MAG: undecaprenyl-diphosphate phosphatase [Candidatus Lokiarchaeota archaeon]|nr:undecaprenyl-diphosphate phosphatase [Candidatus Lokiarchaeota archaeon]
MELKFWQRLILALIQSILEWFPVSSEGFIVITTVNGFHLDASTAIRIALYFHLGTAIAVFFKYRKQYIDAVLLRDKNLLRLLVVSVGSTAMIAIPLKLFMEEFFTEAAGWIVTLLTGVALLVTGSFLQYGIRRTQTNLSMNDRKLWDEIGLGAVQGFAILPGISRSGVTYTYLITRGFKKEDAFKMSFLISLPAVLAGIVFDLLFDIIIGGQSLGFSWDYFFLMALVAIVGYFMMDALLLIARKIPFHYVCFLLGSLTILLVLILFAVY